MSYRVQLDTLRSGFDGQTCWVQCRAGAIPVGAVDNPVRPIVVLTMQKLLLSQSDVFYELNEMRTDDLGRTWTDPVAHRQTLGRRAEAGGIEAVICDATPRWHAATGMLLATGHCARYLGDRLAPNPRRREVAYTTYEPAARTWTPWRVMAMPDPDGKFYSAGAGSAQRVDLVNGEILLPIYFQPRGESADPWHNCFRAAVARCRFDGETLTYLEHGNEITVPEPRGLAEPSLVRHEDWFYLTLRNDVRGYVSRSRDGLHFEPPRPWTFDDGAELGNYNTQQHWLTHRDDLFLVYTRRGLNNDHVFRHRAPLVMAQVDPDKLCIVRATEQVVVPERGARLGNFGVTQVGPDEAWVTVTEWMQTNPPDPHDYRVCQKYGSDNAVFAARVLWEQGSTAANRE